MGTSCFAEPLYKIWASLWLHTSPSPSCYVIIQLLPCCISRLPTRTFRFLLNLQMKENVTKLIYRRIGSPRSINNRKKVISSGHKRCHTCANVVVLFDTCWLTSSSMWVRVKLRYVFSCRYSFSAQGLLVCLIDFNELEKVIKYE